MRRPLVLSSIRSFLVAVFFAALPAAAATITVNTLQDELNADGDCSLREALQAANTNAAVDACTAGTPGLDIVVLPAGTIPLSVTVNITDAVTIRGAGRASTTIQRGTSNAFNGTGVAGATLTLEDLTLQGSLNTGGTQDIATTRVTFSGGIGTNINTLNGTIAITDCTLDGGVNSLGGNITIANTAIVGGVNSSGGALSLTNAQVTGGGVNTSSGNISLTRTSIAGASGTAVNSSTGAVTLVESGVTNAAGEGINTSSGTITLVRSLVSGSQGFGVTSSSGAIAVTNSTITGNEVGIYAGSSAVVSVNASTIAMNAEEGLDGGTGVSFSLVNSIVAGNVPDCGVAVASAQFSLSSDATCSLAGAGNHPSTNPLLGPLANNGGPTMTHLPQSGSPAIDAGSNALCQAVDQRGVARPVDGNGDNTATCDIGAVEVGAGTPPPPPPPPPAPTQPVPTLTEWGLMALVALMALAMARALHRRRHPRR